MDDCVGSRVCYWLDLHMAEQHALRFGGDGHRAEARLGHGNRILFPGEAEQNALQRAGGETRLVALATDSIVEGRVLRQDGHCQSS